MSLRVEIPRKVWTREEAHSLAELGFPGAERLELIDGDLIDRMGKKHLHVLWQHLALAWLQSNFGVEYVRAESPTDVSAEDNPSSEPEPDLMVTTRSIREFTANPRPEELQLVIEVSDTTLALDLQTKAALYARAKIAEYWVRNIRDGSVVVHRDPENGRYRDIKSYRSDEEIAPLAAPETRFRLDRL